jgi:predicted AAA+ superfamily ATPase
LYPLSFDEFLRFKEEGSLTEYILTSPEALPVSEIKRLAALAEEYILFGSFPKLVLTSGDGW